MGEVVTLPTDKFTFVTPLDVLPDRVEWSVTAQFRSAVVRGERVWWFARRKARDGVARGVDAGDFRRAKD